MNVSLRIWVMWEGSTRGIEVPEGVIQYGKGLIVRLLPLIVEKFLATKVVHLECGFSDHKPLIILSKGVQIK